MARGSYNKYRAMKSEVDGIVFDSKKEAVRYEELRLLERAGQIKNLILQPEFELMAGYFYKGEKVRPIIYRADFKYLDVISGDEVVEDVKGFKTEVYKLKKKLFLQRYGHKYNFIES